MVVWTPNIHQENIYIYQYLNFRYIPARFKIEGRAENSVEKGVLVLGFTLQALLRLCPQFPTTLVPYTTGRKFQQQQKSTIESPPSLSLRLSLSPVTPLRQGVHGQSIFGKYFPLHPQKKSRYFQDYRVAPGLVSGKLYCLLRTCKM